MFFLLLFCKIFGIVYIMCFMVFNFEVVIFVNINNLLFILYNWNIFIFNLIIIKLLLYIRLGGFYIYVLD